jgi:hypothetical protein
VREFLRELAERAVSGVERRLPPVADEAVDEPVGLFRLELLRDLYRRSWPGRFLDRLMNPGDGRPSLGLGTEESY